jgi:hypothetical protein
VSASIRRVWADTLLDAERQHLLRLLFWSALSILGATTIAVILTSRRIASPLLKHFALQMLVWGLLFGSIAAIQIGRVGRRDLSGAVRLDRVLWLNIGLDVGYVAVGAVLAGAGRSLSRSMAAVGAGTAIVVQGFALLLIDLQFAALVSR